MFDGVAYLPELDVDMRRAYRESEVHGNAYRKPGKYSLLLSNEVKYPFVRKDARRY